MSHKTTHIIFLSLLLFAALAPAQTYPTPDKKLIVWGGIDWYSPETIQMNIRTIEQLPFDGTVLQGFKTTLQKDGQTVFFDWECFGSQSFQRENLAPTIDLLKAIDFQRFTDNFLRFNVTPGNVDWFDDFNAILNNARLWAEVARETGMKGWAFDVEDYKGTVFSYRKMKYASDKTFADYSQQARLRGGQFIQAVQQGNPDLVILLMLAHSYVYRDLDRDHKNPEDLEYGLLPAFINGMIETAAPTVTIIDGQEQAYGYLTSEDYYRGYHVTFQDALALVPPDLRDPYRAKMDVGIALFVNYIYGISDYPGHYPTHYLTPAERNQLLEHNVYYSLKTADRYAWLYSERLSWWQPGQTYPTPPGALDAIQSAREKLRRNQPLGYDISPARIAAAQATLKLANPYPSPDGFLLDTPPDQPSPKIDGRLDDPLWQNSPPLRPFVPLAENPDPASAATSAYAAMDDDHLYLAFRCAEPQPSTLSPVGQKKDDDIVTGDCVEAHLMVGANSLPLHFIVNPANVQWDGKGDFPDWDAQWTSGAHVTDHEWTAELAIPWKEIGGKPASRSIRAFLCRRSGPQGRQLDAVVQILNLPKEIE